MAIEFINLDEQEQDTSLLPNYPHSISNIKPDTKIIDGVIEDIEVEGICATYDVYTITKISGSTADEGDIDQICIKEDCDTSKYYGCAAGEGGFQKDNLFSELTDEYQRTQARINLGITDEYAMVWGNIKGNLSNQKDLYTFVTDSIAFDINKVIDEINLKLAQWACEIEIRFKNKADIFSPNFAGKPTTTLPLITDNSNRIASTEWVNAKIAAASIDENIKAISLDPEYMCYGDKPTDVVVTWDYYKDVDSQSINGITIPNNLRQYVFSGQTTSMIVTLRYTYGEITASKIVTFDIKYPIYYGISPDYTKLKTTVNNSFEITTKANEYMYVMIPNGINALLAVSSVIGGFKSLGIQEIFGNVYYIFKSANAGLGESTVEIMNQENFESDQFDTTSIKELLASKADKYAVYDRDEIDQMFDDFSTGEGGLKNYYTKQEVDNKIPDVSQKANKSEIPSDVSQLSNSLGYISRIPEDYITESKLALKGYLTEEVEPLFSASIAKTINLTDVQNWNNKVDKQSGMGLSEESFTQREKTKLEGLFNYSDAEVRKLVTDLTGVVNTKAAKSDIPDISGKANRNEIPTKVTQLSNDAGYLTTLPGGLITEEILNNKGYLTSFIETDPTVPAWAKMPTKPKYTLEELGAEIAGSGEAALFSANNYTDKQFQSITASSDPSYNTFKKVGDAIKIQNTSISTINTMKADKTELFSKKYGDLTGTPTIPSLVGYATEVYVTGAINAIPGVDLSGYALKTDVPDISTKVDKIEGKGLSESDYTFEEKQKLGSLNNYDDTTLLQKVTNIEAWQEDRMLLIPKALFLTNTPEDYFEEGAAFTFMKNLIYTQNVTLESGTLSFMPAYSKTGTYTTDANDITYISVITYFHYDTTKDLKMTFNLTSNDDETIYTHTKEFITNSGSNVEIESILNRLQLLENNINVPSIILE